MSSQMKECPFCKEAIKAEAIKCRFCGEFLEDPKETFEQPGLPETETDDNPYGEKMASDSPEVAEPPMVIRLSKICMLKKTLILGAILLITGVVGGWLLKRDFLSKKTTVKMMVGGILISALWYLYHYLKFRARSYHVSVERIESRSGLFSRSIHNLETWRVQDIKLEQPFLQRIFGAGLVVIESTDPDDPHLVMGPIEAAEDNFQAIREISRKADKRRGVVHFDQ